MFECSHLLKNNFRRRSASFTLGEENLKDIKETQKGMYCEDNNGLTITGMRRCEIG